jgi:hypothetical protein
MINGYWGDSESLGAGIVFGAQRGRLYIATADHVIRPRENNFQEVETVEVEFFFRPGEVFTAEVLRPLSEGLDLAVISMSTEGTDIFPSQFPFHRFGDNFVLERSEQMFTVGQGGGRAWNTLKGLVNILESEEGFIDLQFSDVTRGDSGGAVFSESGELSGMVLNSNPPGIEVLSVDLLKETLAESRYPLGEVITEAETDDTTGQAEATPTRSGGGLQIITLESAAEDALSLGTEECSDRGVCLTLTGYWFTAGGVAPYFTVTNRAGSPTPVTYRNNMLRITDDTGKIYEMLGQVVEKTQSLASNESVDLVPTTSRGYTDGFSYLPYFGGVTSEEAQEIYIDVSNFMGINARWLLADLNPLKEPEVLTNEAIVNLGDAYSANGLSISLVDYSIGNNSIFLEFNIMNVSTENILVRYRNTSFEVTDNTGRIYEHNTEGEVKQQLLTPGESIVIESTSSRGYTNGFEYLGDFRGVVSEEADSIIVSLRHFMGIENLAWKVMDANPHSDELKRPNSVDPLEVRQAYYGAGISINLNDATMDAQRNRLFLSFTIRNESPSPILLRYHNDQLRVEDAGGETLVQNTQNILKQRLLTPGESISIDSTASSGYTNGFEYLGAFAITNSTDTSRFGIIFDEFMGLENLEWQFTPTDL